MGNPFVHVELMTKNPVKSRQFYAQMFDWKLEEIPGMDYTVIKVGEGMGGGILKSPDPKIPDHWLPYILVDDIRSATQKARSLGAVITKDVTEVSGYGYFSVISDPTGAAFTLWQAKGMK